MPKDVLVIYLLIYLFSYTWDKNVITFTAFLIITSILTEINGILCKKE